MPDKYILNHGCHNGTMMSRDSTSSKHNTEEEEEEEAYQAYLEHRKFYRSIGYQIWFAEIVRPDGSKRHLESNPYR